MLINQVHPQSRPKVGCESMCLVWHGHFFPIREIKDLVTLAYKFIKTGNTNQIVLFVFYDVCFEVTMGTMELRNKPKSLSQR